MTTSKLQRKPKRLIWTWLLVISMITVLLPVHQPTVQASGMETVAETVYETVYETFRSPLLPILTAEGDGVNNRVRLQWTSTLPGQEYYMVYQMDNDGNGLDGYQSIPLKNNIKVLNVYPDVAGSDGLQGWMQSILESAPDDYDMQVDKVSLTAFNGNDNSTNYAHYLAKDSDGAYAYDVLYFGGWDRNNQMDLSDEAHPAVEGFIQQGGGLLFGHDTAGFDHLNFIDLAQKYLKLDVRHDQPQLVPTIGSPYVLIQRRGFPMNYPFALGDVGTILNTPESHSYYQFARGDVWFKYVYLSWGDNQEIDTLDGQTGTNNFYLTTWNNTALIQTGHRNGEATVDEQKILANTLFYLAQKSTANQFDDRKSQDVAAPNAVSGDITVAEGRLPDTKQISWTATEDKGSSYSYYLKAFSYGNSSSRESIPASATVTTGIKGYVVVVDEVPDTALSNAINTTNASFEVDGLQAGTTYYAHIKAIDNAGNESSVTNIAFTVDVAELTVTSVDPVGKENDGKTQVSVAEEIGQGSTLVYRNAGSGSVTVPTTGEKLVGYTDLPANGLIEAKDGDKIAVAEVDANGKVVRFGQTVAQVIPTAPGLTVTSVDPVGKENDGKTQVSVAEEIGQGSTLVYRNAGSGSVTVPTTGEKLVGYTDLPTDGIIPAAHGDLIAVAELDTTSRVIRFNTVKAIVIATVEEEVHGGYTSSSDTPNKGAEILINGKIEYAGTATQKTEQGRLLTTIDVDEAKLQALLETEGYGSVVTIPWQEQSDIVIGQLTGDMIQEMEQRDATLVLNSPTGSYRVPANQIGIVSLAKQFGDDVKPEDVQLQIRMEEADSAIVQAAKRVSEANGVTMIAPPVTFTVHAVNNGKRIEITDYQLYVERTVALPEGMDAKRITTGVVLEANGTLRHVPTKVTKVGDTYYAVINSLTNSAYGVIWNPVTFKDMAGHWAEASVHNMGSRLVVHGVGDGRFNPDVAITRAEFAAIVVSGLGLRVEKGKLPFTDVIGSPWYANAVSTAVNYGLMSGYEDGSFRPKNKMTRQEAMAMIARAMQMTGLKEQLAISSRLTNVLASFKDGNENMTRAEVAVIVQRLLQYSNLIEN